MIAVDASAIVAILLNETEGPGFRERLLVSENVRISPVGYWEAAVRLYRFRGESGVADLDQLLSHLRITVAPATNRTATIAVEAEAKFGKRTPAKLNLGDCFAYALAKELDAPLLFKGDDFTRTDIGAAPIG